MGRTISDVWMGNIVGGEHSPLNLVRMQRQHLEWLKINFPAQVSYQALLGMGEELGELYHAYLKGEQMIREGTDPEAIKRMKEDAIGDLIIFAMGYCSGEDIVLETALDETWTRVRRRRWDQDKTTGGE